MNKNSLSQFGLSAQLYTKENYSWDKMVKGYISVFKHFYKINHIDEDNFILDNESENSEHSKLLSVVDK